MSAGDARDLLVLVTGTIIPAIVLTWLLTRARPRWRKWVRILLAASPIPILLAVVCIIVFVRAATASRESCGVDACGMAMMFSTFGVSAAVFAYLFGLSAAWLTARLLPR